MNTISNDQLRQAIDEWTHIHAGPAHRILVRAAEELLQLRSTPPGDEELLPSATQAPYKLTPPATPTSHELSGSQLATRVEDAVREALELVQLGITQQQLGIITTRITTRLASNQDGLSAEHAEKLLALPRKNLL